jgi:type IV secretion system protein VirB8
MLKLADILSKVKEATTNTGGATSARSLKTVRNWYEERYDKLKVQRNVLFLFVIVFVLLSAITVIGLVFIINSKEFDPFVIQIEETTGMATVVNPATADALDGNEALAKYFIKKYVTARETYNPVDFESEARKVVRLLSSNNIYGQYLGYIKNKDFDPSLIYGQKNTTSLTVKSWSKLEKKKIMMRFAIHEAVGDKKVFNKIAVVDFDYVAMELTDAERDINPIGFQVKGYRVDDDNS